MQKKYLIIYHDLVKKIQTNVWPTSTMLPSENELRSMYNTSRETIRKSLNLLAQNGYIQKVRGKGSVVIGINKLDFPVSGIVSFRELANQLQLHAKTYVIALNHSYPDLMIREKLSIPSKQKVWEVVRAREIADEKVILDKDYFNDAWVPTLTKEICEDSIYNYLENDCNLSISFAHKEIVVEEPTKEDQELLDLEGFSNVVVIRSSVYLEDATLFQYTESRHRPDKFRFVDFARRIKGEN
ncbi:trehalose operon repressor [Virgibacillus halodenitrificans]|uniref:trehalose operon repressor n=1 Tax=Virgibacillus halodenitrificans TaxID=1482 RepID=UPI0013710D0E|nr:trehalose operon repressor [Virgibacillus halodenitrificans]MYL60021.1 trehalose operon repressor [Virgibacillus halodenitrificans]